MNFKIFKIQYQEVRVNNLFALADFQILHSSVLSTVTSCRPISLCELSFLAISLLILWLNWRTLRSWTMLKQLLNENNGLLLILTE